MGNTKSSNMAEERRRGVGSVDVAGEILRAMLRLQGAARLKDLERETGIAAATIHRYLISLMRCGLARRVEGSNRYDFGLLAYQIGQVASHGNDMVSMIAPSLSEFAEEIHETCAVGIWLGDGVVMARWFEANQAISISLKPGRRLPLSSSSTGRLWAAYLPREETQSLVAEELAGQGKTTPEAIEALYAELEAIREAGISQGLGRHIKGIRSLSVPVFDHQGRMTVALSAIGNEATFNADLDGPIAHALIALGSRLSAQLGAATSIGNETET